jgi:hypothetical protein
MQYTTETPKQYQCRHIFTDGHRCASPCLRQEEFCYYHHTTRRPVANPRQRRSRRSTFHLPLPEDRSAIQSSIGQVLQRIAANEIDPRRAGLLLYGLQIASLNLPKIQPAKTAESQTVEEITIDPTLGVLAPRTDISETKPKSAVALLIERMMQSEEEPAPTPEPATIPTLQATADPAAPSITKVKRRARRNSDLCSDRTESRSTSSCKGSRARPPHRRSGAGIGDGRSGNHPLDEQQSGRIGRAFSVSCERHHSISRARYIRHLNHCCEESGNALSFFHLKELRRMLLARNKRDLVAATEIPASSAISFTEPSFD